VSDTALELRARRADVAALRADVAALTDDLQVALRRMLATEDLRELRKLLPQIHTLEGEQAWSASSLFADALAGTGAEALSDALLEWRDPVGGLRALGRLLERCAGVCVDGLRLVRVASPSAGALYVVRQVSAASKPASTVTRAVFSGTLVVPELPTHGGHR
jgi:hypothetical protein